MITSGCNATSDIQTHPILCPKIFDFFQPTPAKQKSFATLKSSHKYLSELEINQKIKNILHSISKCSSILHFFCI